MRAYQQQFIELAVEVGVLKFGQFKLKSGRISPYFFNSGLFNTGYSAAKLGRSYAAAVDAAGIGYDMLFGPAYKGIPLVSLAAAALFPAAGHRVVDQDAPHGLRRDGKKVGPVLPLDAIELRQFEPGFVDERGRTERVSVRFAPELLLRQPMELLVDQRKHVRES